MALSTGQIIHNRYRIVRKLGEGGFGAVYRVWDITLNTPCALKENFETTPEAARQFAREASILANLRHPNLPRVTDHFTIPGQGQYLAMDFIEGEDLQTLLDKAGGPLPESQVLGWLAQICEALTYLHAQNPPIIHRDIKPQNIIITPQNRAMLVDFGVAKVYDPKLKTTLGARAVTPGYAPIEQYGQGTTDARTDLYALGATAYALLTGKEPPESVQRAVHDPMIPPGEANPTLSSSTAATIVRALQMDASRRFQSAADMKTALGTSVIQPLAAVQASPSRPPAATVYDPASSPPPPIPLSPPREKRRFPWVWVIAGGGLAGLLCILVIAAGIAFLPGIIPTPVVVVKETAVIPLPTVTRTLTIITAPSETPQPTPLPSPTEIVVSAEPLKIALIAPLSGPVPTFGESTKNGALLAVEEWNARGGVLGRQIELVIYDGQCSADPAVSAAAQAIDVEKVHYIVGEICSSASIPISEIVNQAGVVQISPTSTNVRVTVNPDGSVKPYTFRTCFIDPVQGAVGARFAYENLGARTAFVLYDPDNAYPRGLAEAFETTFTDHGGSIVGKETYAASDTIFSTILDKIAAADPDIVYLPDYYNFANMAMSQAKARGINVPFLGGDGWDSIDLDRQAADGSYYTNHYSEKDTRPMVVDWITRYGEAYQANGQPLIPDALATLAYDTVNLMLAAIEEGGVDDPAVVKDVLAGITFEGVTGLISFDGNHNPIKPAVILMIKDGEIRYVTTVTP